jgi:UDPglucose 6-dehydrogenase
VEESCRNLKKVNQTCTVIIKSTVIPGTAKRIISETNMNVISNPEFTREGTAISDTEKPDRVVIGGLDTSIAEKIWAFTESPIITTTNENAELIKYASNAFLAMKISFINEIANLCERIPEADVDIIASGMGYDRRISPHFLKAGIGYGGSCFPKDTEALYGFAQDNGVRLLLVEATMGVNKTRVEHALNIIQNVSRNFKVKKIGVLGIAFKDNTDDIRESKAIEIVKSLVIKGYEVFVFDPSVRNIPIGVTMCKTMKECIEMADAIVIAGEWEEFRSLESMKISKPIIDLKRVLDKNKVINYRGVGIWIE